MPKASPPPPPPAPKTELKVLTRDKWVFEFGLAAMELWPESGINHARKVARLRYAEWKALEPREAVNRWRAAAIGKGRHDAA